MTRSIADAVVIKRQDLFFVCEPSGDVPCTEAHGFGLYYHDCRYLNGYVLRLFDRPLEVLGVDASAGFRASFQLTNPDLHLDGDADDHRLIAKETIALKWERTIDVPSTMLVDVIEVNNFGTEALDMELSLELRAQFEALFEVRGAQPKQRGTLHAPAWQGDRLLLEYDGADSIQRRLAVRFDPAPAETHETAALFRLHVPSRETVKLHVYRGTRWRWCSVRRPSPSSLHASSPSGTRRVSRRRRPRPGVCRRWGTARGTSVRRRCTPC